MVKINISNNDLKIVQVEVRGHAGYAQKGSDIVCAAVSAIVQTAGIGIESLAKNSVCEKEGYYKISTENITSEKMYDAQIILKTMQNGLTELQTQYPKNMKLEVKSL